MPSAKDTIMAIRALGMSVRYDDGEWRINYRGGDEATAYYTTDSQDAIDTAMRMVREHSNPGVPHGTFAKLRRQAVRRGATDPDAYAAFVERKMKHNPMLHFVQSVGPNQTEVSHGDVVGLISYTTPVAIVTRGPGGHYDAFVTEKRWSNTTSRHVRAWLRSRGIEEATKMPQKWIEEALEQGTFHAQNPPLAILSNPRMRRGHFTHGGKMKAGVFSDDVMELRYKHKQDGKLYKHTFDKGVRMRGNEDGTVTLSHPTKPVW
jgi:hypothetical protein